MGVEFSAFRDIPFPTQYGPNRSAVTVDVLEAGLVAAVLIVVASLLLVLPGVKGLREGISITLRVGFALFVASVILVCNFSYDWQVGHVEADLQYKQFTSQHVPAKLGLKIGLRGINITLKGHPDRVVHFNNINETIDYNEHFNFGWDQQLNGFGPNAAQLNQEFRAAQRRGLPLPILSVVEYFALDGESIRWGRLYRQAGYYTHILMWLALPLWVLCCFLSTYLSLLYGAICLMLTGACLLWACVVFVGVHTVESRLVIPIEETKQLNLDYGWGFALSLTTGMLCMVVGLVLTFLVCYKPLWAANLFGTSLLGIEDASEDGMDADDDDVHDYEKVRPRLLTFIGPSHPTRPAENGNLQSPSSVSRTSLRNSFRRRRISRQPSAISNTSGGSGLHHPLGPRVPPRQWRRPRSAMSLGMAVVQPTNSMEPVSGAASARDSHVSNTESVNTNNEIQQTIILYNAVEVPRRPASSLGRTGGPASKRPVPPPRPQARNMVTRMNTGSSTLHGYDAEYMSRQHTREATL